MVVENEARDGLKETTRKIIFEADTPLGKLFDVILILAIGSSVTIVMIDSVSSLHDRFEKALYALEWVFTILFTIEYVVRLMCVGRPLLYARSFFGIIDLLAILPTYLSLIFAGTQYLAVIRILRVLRVFRILKYVQYVREADVLVRALKASHRKIIVFLFGIATLITILGSLMYLVEGPAHGFTSIPKGVYWAIVTLTTVGYGDIAPETNMGQALAALVMLTGYSIIAVPTGIVTVEIAEAMRKSVNTRSCPDCSKEGHDPDAEFCKHCGAELNEPTA